VREIRGRDRLPAVDLACRYQEFLGWLYQDSGQPEYAMVWTSRAYDLGLELGDPQVTSYLLMRRSNIATDAGDPAQALVLADTALREDPAIQGTMKAVILRQRAHASAALGDERGCANAIDQAFEALTLPDELQSLAPYCTPQYVAMEGGTCWLTLNRPDRALATFTQVLDVWPEDARRDHGLSLARLAVAYTGARELEEACRIGQQALHVVTITASARTILELRRLRQQLRAWRRHPAASRLIAGIGSLMGDAT
jgi:tetratricopeptide (TPR) repeat protein